MVEVEDKVFKALHYYDTQELIKLKTAINKELDSRKSEELR